ncbi:hypothetical protein [Occultella gossypii]|uniref:Uncharacterized protein n=1 Tax=Occultella gossypii TaxID=2800820 RepID=A0ABS7SCP8_9MICO|nr:hypothetical protein [Occultella gossypii]MBZ2198134.1 hypothetical protein [Occultella gossypii]
MGTSMEYLMEPNLDILNADLAYRREHLLSELGSRQQNVRRSGVRRLIEERRVRRAAAARRLDAADLVKRA